MTLASLDRTTSRRAGTLDHPVAQARDLVLKYGWNATAYQIVNPGIRLWFTSDGGAVVGYVQRGRTRVVAGAPVCAVDRIAAVVGEFEDQCAAERMSVCYFGAEERLEIVLRGSPSHAMVLLGAQPSWNPARWASIIGGKASLRAKLNRARNKGVTVAPMSALEATGHRELQRVLREWLATRGLPPMHFIVEPETLSRLYDRRVFVARSRGSEIIAFLVASPAPARGGWLIEQ